MTETTKIIMDRYQIRKTKAQKSDFIQYIQTLAAEKGYACKVENGSMGARNIVVGDPDHAKVVYTAHYDTCPVLPFPNFITPKHFGIYLLYQLLLTLFILVAAFGSAYLVGFLIGWLGFIPEWMVPLLGILVPYSILYLLLFGPANRHTANDNTSGVTVLVDILCALPEEQKENVALVFFDLEEMGMIGSTAFAKAHKEAMKDRLLVNFDCVSDGLNLLFALRKSAEKFAPAIQSAFASDGTFSVEVTSKGVFYPSDQMNFPCGVGVAALKCSKKGKVLYMDRIHTPKDTVYQEENISFFVEGALKLPNLI
ncbi:MAG: M28 family peptidase [Clostridia bacterium]|nr:M28 family peptidase [Clostridia bacterium]